MDALTHSPASTLADALGNALARASNQDALALNADWRVRLDDGLQWILETRTGEPTRKSTGWEARKFHVQREPLVASIRRLCGPVEPAALAEIAAWPEMHAGFVSHGQRALRHA